jgi:membrane associated rhomboid family serine protease
MSITITLIIVVMTSIISYQAFTNPAMKQKLIFHPVSVKERGEFYRFLTHGFLHGDFMHLIINMYVLYVFGEQIENIFTSEAITFVDSSVPIISFGPLKGRIIFLLLYFGAIIISSIPQYFRHQDNNYYMALGASGGTSAIVFAYILFIPWEWFTFPPLPGIVLGVAYLMYSSYMDKRGGDNIGHNAHFWGAIYGLVFTLLMAAIFAPDMLELFKYAFLQGPHWP